MSEPTLCLRCGCPIVPGLYIRTEVHHGEKSTVHIVDELERGLDRHKTADDCMVALRRKEVEVQP